MENLKKFLHISPTKREKKEKIENFPKIPEKAVGNHQTISSTVEISREDVIRRPGDVPLAGDELDGEEEEEELESLEKCEGCKRGMKRGKEITLSNGLSWHYNCFRCELCSVDLSSRKYAYNNCLLCEPCIRTAVRTTCHKCILTIEMNDTKLIVDGKEFHRSCFNCFHCTTLLDAVYGKKDGQYYCETCYVERFGKKCSDCCQVILGAGLKFASENYHYDCFKCWKCKVSLAQGAAHSIKGRPVCADCYDQQFLETCSACHQTVAQGLLFREKRFHPACFKCFTCGLRLEDKKGEFLLTKEGLQCKKCVVSARSEQLNAEPDPVTENCTRCSLPIHVKDHVSDGETSWHFKCFVCQQCNSSLVGSKYYDKQGSLYCNNCFLAEHLPTCFQCKVELKGRGGVKMNSESGQVLTWHEDCLQCSVCRLTVSLDNVVFREKLFCKSCYIEHNLNKCDKCSKVITGEGYTFRGNFWHDTCFGCDRCDHIFRDGKFRILREEKLCDTCIKSATNGLQ